MHNFYFVLGDYYGDGHGRHRKFLLSSNKTVEELQTIYLDTCERIGYGLDSAIKDAPFSSYGNDLFISKEQFEKLGIDSSSYYDIDGEPFEIDRDTFVEIFVNFLQTHNDDMGIVIRFVADYPVFGMRTKEDQRDIGTFGYGLFD